MKNLGFLDIGISYPSSSLLDIVFFFMADLIGVDIRWLGLYVVTLSVALIELNLIAAELPSVAPFELILIFRTSWGLFSSFSYSKWKSLVVLVRCSKSSLVECCARQLQFHTVESAVKTFPA